MPALPKTPASEAPLASNARPTPGILGLRMAVGFQAVGASVVAVVGSEEVVDFQVEGTNVEAVVVQVAAEGEAND